MTRQTCFQSTRKSGAHCALWRLFAAALILLVPLKAVSGGGNSNSGMAGIYLSHGSKTDPSMSLSLGADGTATLSEDAGSGEKTFFGHWTDSSSEVTVIFDPAKGVPPKPSMVFEPIHSGLRAITWDRTVWGNVTPPPMKKGYKVKERYWFTTVP